MFGKSGDDNDEWEDVEDEEIWGGGNYKIEHEYSNYDQNMCTDEEMPPLEEGIEGLHYMPEIIKERYVSDLIFQISLRNRTINFFFKFDYIYAYLNSKIEKNHS